MGDVVLLDETKDVGATNRRQLAALYCGATAGYEVHSSHCTEFGYCYLNIKLQERVSLT